MQDINKLKLTDQQLVCLDCDEPFKFTVGEQQYYISKGLATPKRCPKCRQIRKATIIRRDS